MSSLRNLLGEIGWPGKGASGVCITSVTGAEGALVPSLSRPVVIPQALKSIAANARTVPTRRAIPAAHFGPVGSSVPPLGGHGVLITKISKDGQHATGCWPRHH